MNILKVKEDTKRGNEFYINLSAALFIENWYDSSNFNTTIIYFDNHKVVLTGTIVKPTETYDDEVIMVDKYKIEKL